MQRIIIFYFLNIFFRSHEGWTTPIHYHLWFSLLLPDSRSMFFHKNVHNISTNHLYQLQCKCFCLFHRTNKGLKSTVKANQGLVGFKWWSWFARYHIVVTFYKCILVLKGTICQCNAPCRGWFWAPHAPRFSILALSNMSMKTGWGKKEGIHPLALWVWCLQCTFVMR